MYDRDREGRLPHSDYLATAPQNMSFDSKAGVLQIDGRSEVIFG